jgi:hypothetical protein
MKHFSEYAFIPLLAEVAQTLHGCGVSKVFRQMYQQPLVLNDAAPDGSRYMNVLVKDSPLPLSGPASARSCPSGLEFLSF